MDNNTKTREELLTELAEAERQLAAFAPSKAAQQQVEDELARKDEELRRLTEELHKERIERSHLEENYHAFLEQSAEGIYLVEMDEPISTTISEDEQIAACFYKTWLAECNDAMAQMYGYTSASELIGERMHTLVPASDPQNVEYLRAFIRAGYRLTDMETHEVDKDGNPKYFLNNFTGIIKDGFLYRGWGTQRDITNRKLLEMQLTEINANLESEIEERKLIGYELLKSKVNIQTLLDAIPDLLFRLNRDGVYLAYRGGTPASLLKLPEELIGKTVYDVLPADVADLCLSSIHRALETETLQTIEYELPEDTIRRYEARVVANGADEVLAIVREITESKKAEEQLRESEEKFSKAVNLSPHSIGIVSLKDFTYLYLNEQVLATLGYSREELIGRSVFDISFWADAEEGKKFIRIFSENRSLRDVQMKVRGKSGDSLYALISTEPITVAGAPCLLVTGNNITERVLAEQSLKDSEERFQSLATNSPVGIYRLDNEGNCLYVNERWSEITGLNREHAYGRGWRQAIHPDDFKPLMAKAYEASIQGTVFKEEYRVRRPSGEVVWVYNQAGPERNAQGEIIGYVGMLNDITERKLAEEATRQSERRFETLARSSPAGIFRCNIQGDCLYVNEQWCKITGFSPQQARDLGWIASIHPDDREQLIENARRAVKDGSLMKEEHRLLRPNGSVVWVYGQAVPERNDAGEIIGVVGTLTDITERKLAEEALRESEQRYRSLFERNLAGVYRGALSGRILDVNDAYAQIFGYESRDEILALNAIDLFFDKAERDTYLALLCEQGYLTNYELRLRKKDGAAVWVLVNANYVIGDCDDNLIEETLFDITDRKLAEEALRESEARFRVVAETSPGAILLYNADRFVYVNPAATAITGYTSEEFLQMSPWDILDSQDQEIAHQRWTARLHGESIGDNFEYKIHTRSGEERWIIFNPGDFIIYQGERVATATAYDVTERRRAVNALRESENRFRTLAETASDAIITIDEQSRMVFVNPATEKIFGYTQAEMLGAKLTMLMPDELRQRHEVGFGRYQQTGEHYLDWQRIELAGRHKDGSHIPLELSFGEFIREDKRFITGIARDITERKRAEDALRESEAKFRSVAETSPCAIAIAENNLFVYVNPALEKITGYTSDELLNRSSLDFLATDQQEVIQQRLQARERGEVVSNTVESKIVTKSGEERWIEFTSGGEISYQGRKATIGTAFDITARKHAEEMLAAEKERLAVTLRSIGDGVIATDIEGKIVLLNRVAEELTGWEQEAAVGKPLTDIFHIINETTRDAQENPVEKVLRTGQTITLANHTVLIARDGSERPIADSGAPIYDRKSQIIGVVLVFRDMTEELKREAELLRAGKLESIGLLAGGIAHDFNNLLTAIVGNVSLAKRHLNNEHPAWRRLNETEQATMRAKDLTQQLLTFARGGAPIKRTASIGNLLEEAVPFALTGSSVQSEVRLQDNLWLTDIDEGQINQVIHNLVLNARQAMPVGGQVQVSAENIYFTEDVRIQGAKLQAGNYVKITVRDFGVGIPEEYISRIFDPYFTTKQKGSGLGLATSYSIIKNHEGYIFVDSKLGNGTTFELYFPASKNQRLENQALVEGALSGKGRILVMDDEETIREMVIDMLTYLGYEAKAARHGEEAIEMYVQAQQSRQPFDAVLMDLTIPGGMGGEETVKRLLALDPDARCIVSSGYSTAPVMADYKNYGFVAVIAKPFQIVQLNEVLHKVLQGRDNKELKIKD